MSYLLLLVLLTIILVLNASNVLEIVSEEELANLDLEKLYLIDFYAVI